MNAVADMVAALPRHALLRLIRARSNEPGVGASSDERLRSRLARRFDLDLTGLLNAATRDELERIAAAVGVSTAGAIGPLRVRLWNFGARAEAGGEPLGPPLQPVPILLRGKLVYLGEERGLAPPSPWRPRPVPPPSPAPAHEEEPECLEELLSRADRLVGVRLGPGGRDKGAFGARVAALLGVRERGLSEPDWRGEVEIKTVPIARDRSGYWRVREDPAISMETASPLAKLARVLWIARVADGRSSPILSWYYQEKDAAVAALVLRHLHTRPKGGAGARTRGWYLHKRFFAESGFLRSLNL